MRGGEGRGEKGEEDRGRGGGEEREVRGEEKLIHTHVQYIHTSKTEHQVCTYVRMYLSLKIGCGQFQTVVESFGGCQSYP